MLAVLPRGIAPARVPALLAAIKPFRGTLLVGLDIDGRDRPAELPEGLDCVVVSLVAGALPHEAWRSPPAVPVLASRPAAGSVRDRRAACDRLQAELAAWRGPASWDWAGFLADR
jgi:hypothetical protein